MRVAGQGREAAARDGAGEGAGAGTGDGAALEGTTLAL